MADETTRIPSWLVPSKEDLEKIEARNALLRKQIISSQLIDEDAQLLQYYRNEETLAKSFIQGAINDTRSDQRIQEEYRRLTQALLIQGKFNDALQSAINVNDAEYERVQQIADAVARPDSERCSCLNDTIKVSGTDKPLTRFYSSFKLFSPVHQKVMPIYICSKCGFANVTEDIPSSYNALEEAKSKTTGASDIEVFKKL